MGRTHGGPGGGSSRGRGVTPSSPPWKLPPHASPRVFSAVTLALIYILAVAVRMYSVVRFEGSLTEYDPYFNLRATQMLVEEGWEGLLNWFDGKSWYPLGRVTGDTVHPGLMAVSALAFRALDALPLVDVTVTDVCVVIPPLFAANSAMAAYFFGAEVRDRGTGLVAAFFVAVAPGHLQRSVAGAYDSDALATFGLLSTFALFLRASRTGSLLWSLACALAYFCLAASSGAYVFAAAVMALHVGVQLAAGRYSPRLYVAYSVTYLVGGVLAMQVPFVGERHVASGEHLLPFASFAALQGAALVVAARNMAGVRAANAIAALLTAAGAAAMLAAWATGAVLPWAGRNWAPVDPTYARRALPLVASVSENQPATWASFFFDLHAVALLAPAGLRACLRRPTGGGSFLVLYAIAATYFAGAQVRLMMLAVPPLATLAAVSVSSLLRSYAGLAMGGAAGAGGGAGGGGAGHHPSSHDQRRHERGGRASGGGGTGQPLPFQRGVAAWVVAGIGSVLFLFARHAGWVASAAYSTPTLVLTATQAGGGRVIFDDFREAYSWLRHNTAEGARVAAWWDYGHQITAMANRTALADSNAWNSTHIGALGRAMALGEEPAHAALRELGADYVLVVFGGLTGYASDDVNKLLWMVRLAAAAYPGEVREEDYTVHGECRVDKAARPALLASLLYKLSYYRFGQVLVEKSQPYGFDRVRGAEIGDKDVELDFFEEAYTSTNWLVRVYRLKPLDNRW